jgi:hypothetical protein
MDAQNLVPLRKAHFLDHRRAGNAGIVDQAMNRAKGLGDPFHRLRRKCRLGNVALKRHDLAAGFIQGSKALGIPVDRDHPGAELDREFDQRPADSLRASRHDDGFAFQRHDVLHVRFLPGFFRSVFCLHA